MGCQKSKASGSDDAPPPTTTGPVPPPTTSDSTTDSRLDRIQATIDSIQYSIENQPSSCCPSWCPPPPVPQTVVRVVDPDRQRGTATWKNERDESLTVHIERVPYCCESSFGKLNCVCCTFNCALIPQSIAVLYTAACAATFETAVLACVDLFLGLALILKLSEPESAWTRTADVTQIVRTFLDLLLLNLLSNMGSNLLREMKDLQRDMAKRDADRDAEQKRLVAEQKQRDAERDAEQKQRDAERDAEQKRRDAARDAEQKRLVAEQKQRDADRDAELKRRDEEQKEQMKLMQKMLEQIIDSNQQHGG